MRDSHKFFPLILQDHNTVWEKVLHLGVPVAFPAKAVIAGNAPPAEDSRQGMHYIKQGLVKLSSLGLGGQERTMLFMGRGVFFREIPMLLPSGDSMFTCMQHTETVFFPKKTLSTDFIRTYPELSSTL